jgi:hypothetical protein
MALLSKALYNIAHPFMHTTTAESTMQGRQPARREQLGLGALLRDASTLKVPGIELATFAVTGQATLPPELLSLRKINIQKHTEMGLCSTNPT